MLQATDDQVVQHPDVEKRQRLLQALGDLAVGLAGLRVPARVVVEEDDRGSVEVQRALGDDSVVDFACVGRAGEQVLGGKDVVLGVEEDDAEDFVRQVGAAGDQVAAGLLGAVDAAQPLEALLQDGCCCEQDALLVHLELVLGRAVLGAALHRFFSTSALCASWEPAGGAPGPTPHPAVSTACGAQRRAGTTWRRPALAVGTAKLGFPSRGPALVESNDVRLPCRRSKSQGDLSAGCVQRCPWSWHALLAAGCWLLACCCLERPLPESAHAHSIQVHSFWCASQPWIAELWDTRAIFGAAKPCEPNNEKLPGPFG